MMQKSDVVSCGIPPRHELDAMCAAPHMTDIPRSWVIELLKARDQLDAAERLPDGSAELIGLIDAASDTEEQAIAAFNV